jgi:hypothetical protein
MTPGAVDRIRPLIYAIVAVLLAFTWQALTVRYNYGGNWTGLFCTGGNLTQPPTLATEHIYRFPNTYGYDGQYYHYLAHDPLFRNGLDRYIDAPRLRYRRILLPALADMAAAGRAQYVDAAYIAVNLLSLIAGTYWLSRFIGIYGFHPAWGLLFLTVPATVVSLDRMTVDMVLTALCIGFALYVSEDRPGKLYLVLMLAPLARETGLLLIAAYCFSALSEHRFRRAILFATSALPALGWYAFVQSRTAGYSATGWFTTVPLAGLIREMSHPVHYPLAPGVALAADALDELALAGMLLGFIFSFWLMRQKWPRPLQFAALLIALGGLNFDQPFWIEAYSFGRVLSPLLVLIALFACQSRSWIALLPLAMIVPRISLQMGGQIVKVAQGLFA